MSHNHQPGEVPVHLGLILDGNRRWARCAGIPQMEGHREGSNNLHRIAKHAIKRGVKFVSAYVFSTENWNRPPKEVNYLMRLLVHLATKEIEKYDQSGIKVVFVGSREGLSKKVLQAIEYAEKKTAGNKKGVLALCVNYGGHLELADGMKAMLADGVKAEEISPELVERYLYQSDIPPLDMIIRTSGEQRLSNFMLWRAAYAELTFVDKFWPDFAAADLDAALDDYALRQRRFGS